MLPDLRQAVRMMVRAPGFTMLAVLILAIGIGAATLVFSLVHAALVRALPFDHPERIVWMYNLRTERDRAPLSIPDVDDYRRQSSSLAGLALFTNWSANLTGIGTPERLEGTRVSGNFFELLGLRPLIGRSLQADDERGDARVTVLTHGLWLRRFGGDAAIVGRTVALNGADYTVVGVLPPGFMFPFRDAELAVPLVLHNDPRRADRGANFLRVVARLGPGVTIAQAKADLDTIAHRLQRLYPTENARKTGVSLYPLHTEIVRDYQTILWTLFAAVAVLLAVGCGNLANLLLVRNAGRQTELALRLSLGASRGRLVRLLLCEAVVLAIAGAIAGIALAAIGLVAWRAWGPASFPRMTEVTLNTPVLLFAMGVACATALACGALPAWFASRDTADALRGGTRAMTTGRSHARARRTLVGLQVAAATVLLVGMGLTARGFTRLARVAPGFTPDRSLAVQLSLPPRVYANRDALVRFAEALERRLVARGDVESTGLVSLLPLSGLLSTMDVAFPDREAPAPDEVPQAHFRVVSPGYFAAAGIAVLQGRVFTEDDRTDSRPVAIVSRTFAERHWPGGQAVGRFVQIVQATASAPIEVVGMVSDVKQFTLDAPSTADLYVPLRQMPSSQASLLAARMFWIVRGREAPATMAGAVREAVSKIDPGVATSSARTLDAVLSASLGARRVNVRLLQAFGLVAMLLCAIAAYGVAAFSARVRRRELAIRAALGARRFELATLMLRSELRPVIVGIAAGLLAAFVAATRVFGTPFETDPHDVVTYVAVGVGLLIVATIASAAPARRAGATNPIDALNLG
jgi:putative ABC transport system permease protein